MPPVTVADIVVHIWGTVVVFGKFKYCLLQMIVFKIKRGKYLNFTIYQVTTVVGLIMIT